VNRLRAFLDEQKLKILAANRKTVAPKCHEASRGSTRPDESFKSAHARPKTAVRNGGPDRDQTDDLVVANDALYQLSYRPMREGTYWENVGRK
jgi:hypothetical protein